MNNRETWAERVGEWKASGLTSTEYCEGKPFSAGGLRHMAHRIGRGEREAEPEVRLAKVLRVPSKPESMGCERHAGPRASERPSDPTALIIECGVLRVAIRPGFDRETLAAVLDVLAAREGAR